MTSGGTGAGFIPGLLSAAQWRRQLARQEQWTRDLRSHLYRRVNLWARRRVLDVGCGDGLITAEMASRCRGRVIGVDLSEALLSEAHRRNLSVALGDAQHLPFTDGVFDLAVCHMTLLWVAQPAAAIREMARVIAAGGAVVALAEPDYGGRIDFPEELAIGPLAARALEREGAHARIGRRLQGLFVEAGLEVETGVLSSVWSGAELRREFDQEWELLEATTGGLVESGELAAMKRADLQAIEAGVRVVFIPMFWAIGKKRG